MSPFLFRGLLATGALLLALFGWLDAGARRAAAPPAAPPQWGPATRVNPASSVTPNIQRNYTLAVNPADPNEVIAGYDSWNNYLSDSAVARSTDAGRTWQGGWFYGPWLTDTVPNGNTSVGADAWGTLYYTTQVLGSTSYGYVVLTSTAGSAWSTPVPIVLTGPGEYYVSSQ